MRNMSFFYTQPQIRNETKDVTRRMGWEFLKRGDLVMAVVKGQGIPKGGSIERIRVLRILDARGEQLAKITQEDVVREGFPEMSRDEFIKMFRKMNGVTRYLTCYVNRVELEYVEKKIQTYSGAVRAEILRAWAKWPETKKE